MYKYEHKYAIYSKKHSGNMMQELTYSFVENKQNKKAYCCMNKVP